MAEAEQDEARERRIHDEVVVDAHDEEERALGWYYYLEDRCTFPFRAVCASKRAISPLQEGETVEVLGMGPEEECKGEMFVEVRWKPRPLAVPLIQLRPLAANEDTDEAVADWHYWMDRGYEF
jgi:hypothetical protein